MNSTSTLKSVPTALATGGPVQYGNTAGMRRYMLLYALVCIAISAIWGGIGHIMLPMHIQQIEFSNFFTGANANINLQELSTLKTQVTAGSIVATSNQKEQLESLRQFEAARAQNLSLATSIGVLMTMLVQPIVGALSDRTRSGLGRRAPWIIGGGLLSIAGLIGLWNAETIVALIACWGLLGIATNAAIGPLNATVADRIPEEKVGMVSTVTGLGLAIGLILGMVIGGALFTRLGALGYLPFAVAALFCLLFVFGAPDRSSSALQVRAVSLKDHLRSFTFALKDRDFRWVWISKVVLMFAWTVSSTFSLYMLQSYINPALSALEAAKVAPMLSLSALPGTLIAMAIAGKWSDKIGRRKPFVIGSSLLFAASMVVPAVWATLPALFIQSIVGGIALGSFIVVDQALFIDVLPEKEAAGRDLGIANVGGNLGQAMGPILAGAVISLTGSYQLIWITAAVLVLIAAAAIVPVKRAK